MITRAALEKKLIREASALKLQGERRDAYIEGTLAKMFPVTGAPRKKNPVRRKKNPVKPAGRQTKVEQAMRLFQRFRLQEPEFVDEIDFNPPDVCMLIGKCDGVLYTTVRNGKTEEYIHKFTGKSKPLLVAKWDGSQIYFVGGNYDFTPDGIIDRK